MVDLIKKYIDNKIQLVKLELISVSANLAAKLITFFVIVLLVMIFVVLFNFAIAYGIGQSLNNMAFGFAIVGGFYLLLFILFYLFGKDKFGMKVKDYVVKIAMGVQDELNND